MYRFERNAYEKRMQWFREARFGLFLHWGLYAIPARGEWVRNQEQMPEESYLPFFEEFISRGMLTPATQQLEDRPIYHRYLRKVN